MRKLMAATIVATLALPAAAFANHDWDDADTNKDGVITKAEFDSYKDKKFAEKDTNGDGKITKAEHESFMEKMKAKWKDMKNDNKNDNDRDDY